MTDSTGVGVAGNPPDEARFGVFTVHLRTGELRRDGVRLKLQEQPFRLLVFLLEHAGDIVTREQLRDRLWPSEFVDFDHGLNTAVRKLRTVLDDTADNPRFIETLARRGYRFIAPVTWPASAEAPAPVPAQPAAARRSTTPFLVAAACLALVIAFGTFLVQRRPARPKAKQIATVAVLPFANAEGQNEHVSDGLTEILIDTLSRIPDLRVTARTTVFRYKGKPVDPQRAGKELRVDAIVSGEVARHEDGWAIRIELIDAADGSHMWGSRYQASSSDLAQVHGRISEDLSLRLREEEAHAPRPVYTANAEAYELYLKGLYLWNTRTPANVKQSADYFTRATQLDPKFATAYGNLSNAYGVMSGHGLLTPEEGTLKVMAAASKALELDPHNAEALASMATTKYRNLWDFAGADRDYRRAIASNPGYATAHQWYADYLRSMGRPADARREIDIAYRLDPFSVPINRMLCDHLYFERNYQEAIALSARVAGLDPRFVHPSCLESTYAALSDHDSELATRMRYDDSDEERAVTAALADAYRRSGRDGLLRKRVELLKARQSVDAIQVASAYAALGDNDQAFAWLEKAYQKRVTRLTSFHVDPAFDSLRIDPRFDALRERIGLP